MPTIERIHARQILDSRGNPTVEVDVALEPLRDRRIEPRHALVFAAALEVAAFAVLWWGANLLSAVLALSATAFYVGRVHAVAEAHEPPQHRDRRRRRRRAGARRLGRRHRLARLGAGRAVRRRCSSGRRRTSGRWPSATPTTTAPPTCRCCPAVAPLARGRPPDDRLHRRLVVHDPVLVPVADLGWIYTSPPSCSAPSSSAPPSPSAATRRRRRA